jgi:cobalt-zinc-cadmium efflux system membrane fusion protein
MSYEELTMQTNINQALIRSLLLALTLFLLAPLPVNALVEGEQHEEEDHHEDEGQEDEGHEEGLKLSVSERNKAGIELLTLERKSVSRRFRVPGEVQPNAYKSAKIAPRITAQVVERQVRLGEHVSKGQPLVTLLSVEMADAQGEFIVADQEWQRAQALGKDVLSGRRYTEAQVNRQRAMAKVLAYGMTEQDVSRLLKSGDASLATGEFTVVAPLSGTILQEDFVIGELIEPGHVLFEISDETSLWVEARVSGNTIGSITEQTQVRISPDQDEWREAKVVQLHHRLNEVTRTQAVRLEFNNEDDWLHAGQFVEVELAAAGTGELLVVPAESIVMLKNATVVFRLESGGEFHPEQVTAGASYGDDREILLGLTEGDRIAATGAFYLKSLLLKSELGDGHAH